MIKETTEKKVHIFRMIRSVELFHSRQINLLGQRICLSICRLSNNRRGLTKQFFEIFLFLHNPFHNIFVSHISLISCFFFRSAQSLLFLYFCHRLKAKSLEKPRKKSIAFPEFKCMAKHECIYDKQTCTSRK